MAETERHFDLLQGLIDKAFKQFFKGEEGSMNLENNEELKPMGAVARSQAGESFACIQDYTEKTGKRFRMTKDQKHRGLSREEAFSELYGEKNNG